MVVRTPNVEGVFPLEPEDDPVLVVDANRGETGQLLDERVEPVSRRHPQLFEVRHRVELIQSALNDGPELYLAFRGGAR